MFFRFILISFTLSLFMLLGVASAGSKASLVGTWLETTTNGKPANNPQTCVNYKNGRWKCLRIGHCMQEGTWSTSGNQMTTIITLNSAFSDSPYCSPVGSKEVTTYTVNATTLTQSGQFEERGKTYKFTSTSTRQ